MDGCSTSSVVDTTLLNFQLICHEALQAFQESYIKFELIGSSIANLWDPDAENERSDLGGVTIVTHYNYFDKYRDTLFLTVNKVSTLQSHNAWIDVSKVRNLALSFGYASVELRQKFGPCWEYIEGCSNLESLTFVIGSESLKELGAASYHLVKVDDDFRHLVMEVKSKNKLSDPATPELERCIDRLPQEFRDLESLFWREKPTDKRSWPDFDLKIALLGKLRHVQKKEKIIWLKPKDSTWPGLSYFMKEPASVPTRYFMRLRHLHCDAYCDSDGRLLTESSLPKLEDPDTDEDCDSCEVNAPNVRDEDAGLALWLLEL
ncbi:hypothetical protein BDZ45DRAFT_94425 [Acephala macrosclerotiorum]|nr:hypothetical protein BDZ45DRAFT_94425 [Acephala macrosclerotiorum]